MRMRIWNSLQAKFFLTYSIIFIAIILIVSIPMYIYLKNNIENNTLTRLEETLSNVKNRTDERMQQFDVISRLLYFQTNFSGEPAVQYLNDLLKSGDFYEKYRLTIQLKGFVSMLSAVYPDAQNIRVFTATGQLISFRDEDNITIGPLDSYPKLAAILPSNGETLLSFERTDPWSTPANGVPVFVFSRMLMPWETRAGILEVQVKAEKMLPLDLLDEIEGANLRLFSNDQLVYSTVQDELAKADGGETEYRQLISEASASPGSPVRSSTGGHDYVFYQSAPESGLSVMLTVPEDVIFKPLLVFRNVAISTILLLIAFSVTVFYVLSRILTQPLKQLKNTIDTINLDDFEPNMDNKYRMDEINRINRSFRSMNERLQNSLEETVRFRTLQLQANFDMLQAQINPHFLFNMLGFIQASAEDRDLDQVGALSRNLLGFFRYSLSTQSPVITLEKEVDFTNQYLELMQIRFMHRLSYRLDIDPMLQNMVVPKLILQPLVENSLQHGMGESVRTLEIHVRAFIEGMNWVIHVEDNGVGFSEDRLAEVKAKVDDYLDRIYTSTEGERLSLGGMGVANSMSRLKFMFKEQFSYRIGNRDDLPGVRIVLRGPLKR